MSAVLKALAQSWRDRAGEKDARCSDHHGFHRAAMEDCADELDAAIAEMTAQAVDLAKFKDLIGFAAWQAIQLPETDHRRDFIRQANDMIKMINSEALATAKGGAQ